MYAAEVTIQFWARKGFDIANVNLAARRGCLVGLVKLSRQKLNANNNEANTGMAMSVAQADAVLNKL